jgi:hypothetical protein
MLHGTQAIGFTSTDSYYNRCASRHTLVQASDDCRDGGETCTWRVLKLHRKILAGTLGSLPREGRLLDLDGRRTSN